MVTSKTKRRRCRRKGLGEEKEEEEEEEEEECMRTEKVGANFRSTSPFPLS